ncbi:DUF2946 family protein [Caenimonas soli]|uniref:DUF2946 family protein n=1 Tax=Caenimonas soli TaxID=2735555 RepID=UPI00155197C6|nr:DUF2946 family protein [Caenimonas soli]NPC55611.1 hypothetical protein [Caenimonas soli]
MIRLRMFLAWLLLLAIPLQGLAAASMLYCGPAAKAQAQQTEAAHEHHGHDVHESPAVTHDHAKHHQAAPDTGEHSSGSTLPDAGHKCSICAACCHAVAVNQTVQSFTLSEAPRTTSAEPLVLVYSRPTPVPDKPPRA